MRAAAPPALNGQSHAAATPGPRLIVVGARGLTWSVVIQLVLMGLAAQAYVGSIREELHVLKADSAQRFDSIDRRLSTLDGVVR